MNKKLISIIVIVAFFSVAFCGSAFARTYRVNPGDNLYDIGQKFGISFKKIMAVNAITSSLIHPGDYLIIPGEGQISYEVQKGDNLYKIGKKFKVSIKNIIAFNNLDTTLIYPGQKLTIPEMSSNYKDVKPAVSKRVNSYISENDIKLLAQLIHAEARGEDYLGKVAVGAVILNRLYSSEFPNNIRDIIYQRTKNGVYQFTPVSNGTIKLQPSQVSIKAAQEAIAGNDPTKGAVFFYNPKISTDRWIKTLPVSHVIGNHAFAR